MSYQLRPIQELIEERDDALREAEDAGVEMEAALTTHQQHLAKIKRDNAIQMAAMWGACISARAIIEQIERERFSLTTSLQAQDGVFS